MPDLPAIREALSWHIAAAFARRHPEAKVQRSLLPEGVGYDTLVLHTKNSQLALLNRGGRAHVGDESFEWERVAELGIYAVVERIEAANDLAFFGKRPPTSRRVLTYRAISRLLNDAVFGGSPLPQNDGARLQVEPCHWDSSWDDAPAAWVSDFPAVGRRIGQDPCQHQFWHVKGPDTSIAFDARTGEAWSRGGEQHLDLPRAYSSADRKFDAFMEEVHRLARTPSGSPRLPGALDLLAEHEAIPGPSWGPHQEGEGTPFPYRASYQEPNWNEGLFEDPMFRLDLLTLVKSTAQVFSITFAGEGGTPVWISGTRSRGRLALETGYGHPGALRKPKRGGTKQLRALGWKPPVDEALGGFTAALPDGEAVRATDLILRTLQSSAYGQLHTMWFIWPRSLADIVARARAYRPQSLHEPSLQHTPDLPAQPQQTNAPEPTSPGGSRRGIRRGS